MSKLKWIIPSLLLALFIVLPAHAEEAFEIENFITEISMNADSSLDITETIEVVFSEERHGIFRDIHDEDIDIEILEVTDENGDEWNYVIEYSYLTTRIRIGDADKYIDGPQTFKIKYKVEDAILFFQTHNELYWNATGAEWDTVIKNVKTIVTIPETIEANNPDVRFRCFTGPITSKAEDCSIERNGNKITYTINNPLGAYEGLTVVTAVPRGHITIPATLKVTSDPLYANVYLNGSEKKSCEADCTIEHLMPGLYDVELKKLGYQASQKQIELKSGETKELTFALTMTPWFRALMIVMEIIFFLVILQPIYKFIKYGKDPKGRSTIIAEYGPPDNISPAEMGTLVDERADLRDISATIIDLAVRGYIKIHVIQDKKTLFKQPDYEFIRLAKPKRGRDLTPFEKKIMSYIFVGGEKKKKLSALQYKFYSKLPKLKEDLYKSLVDRKYFKESPDKVRKSSFGLATGTIFAGIFMIPVEAIVFGSFWSFGIFFNGIVAFILYRRMPKKTKAGMLAYQHILGFEEYLTVAEKYRLEFEEKENLFFQFLPYAMTLGVAKKWSKAFKNIYKTPPDWISGLDDGEFKPIEFVNTMNSMTGSITRTMRSTYTPPSRTTSSRSSWSGSASSGSSGFSSSGSSGGGFGGGGGGSW